MNRHLAARGAAIALGVLFLSAFAPAPTAGADDTATPSGPEFSAADFTAGGGVTDPSIVQVLSDQARAKVELTRAYVAAATGGDRQRFEKLQEAYQARYGGPGPGSRVGRAAEAQASDIGPLAWPPPAIKALGLTQYGQINGYFCGPASGYMIIRYLHGSGFTSRQDGSSLTQSNVGNANHMNTWNLGGTPWTSGRFAYGINRWRGVNWYVEVPQPSSSLLPDIFLHSIGGNSMPIGADTVEFAGGVHYNGHPVGQTIGHWIVGYGYSNSGGTSNWADPATTVWSSVSRYFTYSTGLFATRFLQSNGVVY